MGKSDGGRKWERELTDVVLSWSIKDILDEELYKNKVTSIPKTFSSVEHYFNSFRFPLLEETRADLCSNIELISQAPVFTVISLKAKKPSKKPSKKLLYDVRIRRLNDGPGNEERYIPTSGDILALSSVRPRTVVDLEGNGGPFTLAAIISNKDHELLPEYYIEIKASISIEVEKGQRPSLFAVFLSNITTNNRMCLSLNSEQNLNIIRSVLDTYSLSASSCNICSDQPEGTFFQSELNESQKTAISNSLSLAKCEHKHGVQLVWGPPGTGKTKTISALLWALVEKKHRTVTCAPTNIAVLQIASRLLALIKASRGGDYLLGDVVLYGNPKRMKIDEELKKIFLGDREQQLAKCFSPRSGWKHQLAEMIDLLQNSVAQYAFQEKRPMFRGFLMNRFSSTFLKMKKHLSIFRVHLSNAFVSMEKMEEMVAALSLLESFYNSLRICKINDNELKLVFGLAEIEQLDDVSHVGRNSLKSTELRKTRLKCIQVLETLRERFVFPKIAGKKFCLEKATIILCTAVSSYKLQAKSMKPLKLCVIDEAAQLKECESLIPLQLKGVQHAILIGDECQLSAMVMSKVSEKAGLGRSLFQRLVSLGHEKELLSVQYRMHPSISQFPNSSFYNKRIQDGQNVKSQGFERSYCEGKMFGPYSFISVPYSTEILDIQRSLKNLVEVAVISQIIRNLFIACRESKKKVSIGIISPYSAQVAAISESLGKIYGLSDRIHVKIKTVDGFQGGEEDIIIISTVRANDSGSVGFLSNLQRTNVALTRAKYCLWILGHEPTLVNSGSIWKDVVLDAKDRNCFFNADEDESLAEAIVNAKVELGQFHDMLQADSLLFRKAKWKVLFSANFRNSFERTKGVALHKQVVTLLIKLSNGHRPVKNKFVVLEGSHMELLQLYLVGDHRLFWSVDVHKYSSYSIQVLKFWGLLPPQKAPEFVKHLKIIFSDYTEDYISRCKFKRTEGGLELPMRWEVDEHDDRPGKKEVQDLLEGFSSIHLDEESSRVHP
ncbi:probable helicase MAGATAMA 3 [Aristolochia californica]|uniref:probable helicase MAGATAMA 3 n=1 Tax=Aristolochia californica TaxID=171875 RepID=UPI0035D732A2